MHERIFLPAGGRARLCLEYGIDEQLCESGLSISERGMRFVARWHFAIGTQLAVSCLYEHPQFGWLRVRLEGTVVWSEPIHDPDFSKPAFDTTVLFLELPDDLKQSLREFSFLLEAATV
jgi:PilZ domain